MSLMNKMRDLHKYVSEMLCMLLGSNKSSWLPLSFQLISHYIFGDKITHTHTSAKQLLSFDCSLLWSLWTLIVAVVSAESLLGEADVHSDDFSLSDGGC